MNIEYSGELKPWVYTDTVLHSYMIFSNSQIAVSELMFWRIKVFNDNFPTFQKCAWLRQVWEQMLHKEVAFVSVDYSFKKFDWKSKDQDGTVEIWRYTNKKFSFVNEKDLGMESIKSRSRNQTSGKKRRKRRAIE